MPGRQDAALKRAATLRRLFTLARQRPIGFVPEGRGSGVLQAPPQGSGLLMELLSRSGLPIVPAGVWEEDDELVVSFSKPFAIVPIAAEERTERDRLAREQVMVAIGRLLPEAYQGVYSQAINAARSAGT